MSPVTRRQFIRRTGVLGAAGLTLPAILAACGDDDEASDGTAAGGTTPSTSSGTSASTSNGTTPVTSSGTAPGTTDGGGESRLFFENWPEYIDLTEDGALGTVDRFMEATGVQMKYTEAFNDNNEYFALIQPLLGTGKTIDPDIIAPTSWLAGRLITLGWVDKLPLDQVPNAANLRSDLVNPAWDPTGEYSLPWQTGITGIAYNLDATGRELKSVEDLFDPAFNGKIGMLTEMRDTVGLILLSLGVDPSTVKTFDEAAAAFDKLAAAKSDGQIRAFTGNDYLDDLSTGNFAACIGWSGDVVQLSLDNPAVKFVIPEDGGISWADTMVMPKGAENRDAVAKWMDFVYDPVQAAQLTVWVQYVSPVSGVRDEVAKLDAELAESPLLFPDDSTLEQLHAFANLPEDVEAQFDAAFSDIVGA
ncbi:MAG: spermidine/putrescine ABC transporter substrate-binding protein [Acidimicrobiia bacterium]|nr:spermidine/putrescine ABC transporter substrate-binding protein [Acidimicrobiia bacterium]